MPAEGFYPRPRLALPMRASGRCPKCGSTSVRLCPSVRAGGGPLSVGDFAADAFTLVSQFDAFVCMNCGFTELYLKPR